MIECRCGNQRATLAGLKAAGLTRSQWEAGCDTCYADKNKRTAPWLKKFLKEAFQ